MIESLIRKEAMKENSWKDSLHNRRYFVGGSDARIIMGDDEHALIRLWREKRGEVEPNDLSGNLVVQLGVATEDLNRHWFEGNTGQALREVRRRIGRPVNQCAGAALVKPEKSLAATGDDSAPPTDEEKAARLFSPWMPRLSTPKAFPAPVFVDEFEPRALESGSDCLDSFQ
jgi:hypothetical protein